MTFPDRVAVTGGATVMFAWIAFMLVMAWRPRPPAGESATSLPSRRDRRSMLGIALQGAGFATVWTPPHWGFGFTKLALGDGIGVSATLVAWYVSLLACAVFGVLLFRSAVNTLGREWSIVARVAHDHRLVMTGPYARIRHPIYTSMLLMLVATGLGLSGPVRLAIALVLFSLGAFLRIRIEETLLRVTFGPEFDAYAARVPAVVPRFTS